jgi:poly(A) polymerase/tRNA nucleotidyltransferase (CCA-adding enzyme)
MIPDYLRQIIKTLETAGYEAWVVGGSVRDLLLNKPSADWDLTTNARPEQILAVFADAVYENNFGTVIVKVRDGDDDPSTRSTRSGHCVDAVEVTTYRSEQGYSDRRHPDEVKFEDSLDKDLARRDFTVNALALRPLIGQFVAHGHNKVIELDGEAFELVDYFGGEKDIKQRILRAVGEPMDRFKEDALRMMRGVRFVAQLNFKLEPKTERAIAKMAGAIRFVANERIHDELVKILKSRDAYYGIIGLKESGLLQYIIPELMDGVGVKQNHHHIYDVFTHCALALKHCPNDDYRVRLAALLHDVGKPKTKKFIEGKATFYNHEYVGAKMTERIMKRLKFSTEDLEKVVNLVKNHMFYYMVDEVTATSVRRLIAKTGRENLQDLIDLRVADRLGSGTPKAMPYKLRHLQYMMDKVQNDPVSVKMLQINGDQLMPLLKIKPGPIIGAILDVLLAEVIEQPELNTYEWLSNRSQELVKLELSDLRQRAKEVIVDKRAEEDKQFKRKHKV